MSDERNALAELADELWSVSAIMTNHDMPQYVGTAKKASRIIAELAKVSTLGPKHIPGDISLYKAYAECRAIAEE